MFEHGFVNGYEYKAKVFDMESDMGINRGRISKLAVKKDGKLVANYDRGWDMRPTTDEAKAAVKAVVKMYK